MPVPRKWQQGSESIVQAEHISPDKTGDNIEAKKVASYVWDSNSNTWARMAQPSITTGDVTVNGTSSYSDSGGTERRGLVDADRHVQVDVLTAPTTAVTAASLPLPTGAATSAKQDTGNTSLASIDTKLDDLTTPSDTQPVSAASLPLPTGAATSAKQDTIIGHIDSIETVLGTIDTDTGNIATNQTSGSQKTQIVDSGGEAVTVTDGKLDVNATVELDPGSLATSAKQDDQTTLLTAIEADTDTLAVVGGGTEASALRVTIASDSTGVLSVDDNGGSLTVDNAGLTELAAAIDTEVQVDVVGALPAGTNNIGDVDIASLPNEGQQTMANSISVAVASNQSAIPVDGSGVTQPVSNAGLTELAAAINSSKVDVNIVSSDVATSGTSAADDADFTAGTTSGTPAMGVYESSPSSVTDGDLGTVGITQTRRLKTSSTIDTAIPAGNNNIGDVDVASSVLPTGAATSAKQDTVIGHLDGVEGLLTTIDADTGGILTAVQTLDNAISGNEMQVDVVAALPAGTNAVGRVGHDITSIGHGVATVTTAGTDVALASSTACKRITIQAQTDNTGVIAVGGSGVDATVSTGTGVLLFPGDVFELEIDNLAEVFIDASVNGEGARYTYFA